MHRNKAKTRYQANPRRYPGSMFIILIIPDSCRQVIPLVVLQICESFNSSSIFSYVPFLVQDFTDANRDTAGTYAGLVASAVYLGSFVSSYLWGKLSDRIGKRPCLIIGSTGTLLCCLMFGMLLNLICRTCSNGFFTFFRFLFSLLHTTSLLGFRISSILT